MFSGAGLLWGCSAHYATDDKDLLFRLRLAPCCLSDFSRNAYNHILSSRKGAKREILEVKLIEK